MKRRIPRLLRRIAALLILACLVLPMSRCTNATQQADAQGRRVTTTQVEDIVPYEFLDDSASSAAWMLLFTWPLLSQCLLAWRPRIEGRRIYLGLEALLVLPTAWLGYALATLGQELRYGAFVLAVSLATYLVVTLGMLRRPPRMDDVDPG